MSTLNKRECAGAGLAGGSVLLIGGSVAASSLLAGTRSSAGRRSATWRPDFSWPPGRGCNASRCPARQAGSGRGWPH